MILIPQAKPVRIRIESGGVEHSSLDSLRENFNYNDVFNLCQKGSIFRWLEQQNEELVLERLKEALADDTNNEEKYRLNIVLSFFPDAVNLGVQDTKSLLLFWAKRNKKLNIYSFLDYVYDKKVLHNLLKNIDDDSAPIKIRLGKLYFDSGDLQAAANLGYGDAIIAINKSLSSFASYLSPKDISSFLLLKQNYKNIGSLNPLKFTKSVRDYVLLVTLIQEIISRTNNIENLSNYLSNDERIKTKVWPVFLMPYITYSLWAYRKYVSCYQLDKMAYKIYPRFDRNEDGCYRFYAHLNYSQAQKVLFLEKISWDSPLLKGISMQSIDYLRKIRADNKEAFTIALDSICNEILNG